MIQSTAGHLRILGIRILEMPDLVDVPWDAESSAAFDSSTSSTRGCETVWFLAGCSGGLLDMHECYKIQMSRLPDMANPSCSVESCAALGNACVEERSRRAEFGSCS